MYVDKDLCLPRDTIIFNVDYLFVFQVFKILLGK